MGRLEAQRQVDTLKLRAQTEYKMSETDANDFVDFVTKPKDQLPLETLFNVWNTNKNGIGLVFLCFLWHLCLPFVLVLSRLPYVQHGIQPVDLLLRFCFAVRPTFAYLLYSCPSCILAYSRPKASPLFGALRNLRSRPGPIHPTPRAFDGQRTLTGNFR